MSKNPPLVFLLHALGASSREWSDVIARLGAEFDCVALDLPGFGGRSPNDGVSIADMTDGLAEYMRRRSPAAYILVGHSMSAKLCSILARRAEDGEEGLSGLAGLVLVAGSPPASEPMEEEARAEMIGWAATGRISEEHARSFVSDNVATPLPDPLMALAVQDVERSHPFAWRAWLEHGARGDWSGAVGRLQTPARILAGAEDSDLGEDAQRRMNLPHYVRGRLIVVEGAGHLIPYERPDAVADNIRALWSEVRTHELDERFARMLASSRVSRRTRKALLDRRYDPVDDEPGVLGLRRLDTLRAVLEVVLPHGRCDIDLARRIDVALAKGAGDGWRFADLPSDQEAWRQGLDTLDAATGGFRALAATEKEAWLKTAAAGELAPDEGGRLGARQMKLWFEDLRAEAVRTWLAHPTSLARIGYDGFANGGDVARQQGYVLTHADETEPWQPPATNGRAAR